MKILVVHNSYQQRGGEDAAREAEVSLLREAGHEVVEFLRNNNEIRGYSLLQKAGLGCRTVWSQQTYRELRDLLLWEAPDIAHFHNTFPLISPAAHFACADAGVPVVQTLHNYRLLCPGANFLRDGRVCEECLGRSVPWPAVWHGCYRESHTATASVAAMLAVHHTLGTWWKKVGVFIALTEFARQKHIQGGLPGERIAVKPNFLPVDPGAKTGLGECALYVGRLSEEKGVRVLLDAWSRLDNAIPLLIAGEGPLVGELMHTIESRRLKSVSLLSGLPNAEVLRLLHRTRFLVLPSICFEGFPMTVVEAFACGVPVVASSHGGAGEIIHDARTGLHSKPNDAQDLAEKASWAWKHAPQMEEMGRAARSEFETKYTAKHNYRRLLEIYEQALEEKTERRYATPALDSQRTVQAAAKPDAVPGPQTAAHYRILGVRVNAVQFSEVIVRMENWIARREACRFIAVADMHSVMEAVHSRSFKSTLEAADMVVPDGFPLVWFGRRKGFALHRRVYGPQLMALFCEQSVTKGYRHFFYGGAPGVADNLASRFSVRFPGLQIAGVHSPPFRPLTPEEDRDEVAEINAARADVIWVGLGAPKQEKWMLEHGKVLNAPVLVGVGAAFDFHSGRIPQAPSWMGDHGLEWFYRLMMEPRRLWRRYLIHGSEFAALVLLDLLGVCKFD